MTTHHTSKAWSEPTMATCELRGVSASHGRIETENKTAPAANRGLTAKTVRSLDGWS